MHSLALSNKADLNSLVNKAKFYSQKLVDLDLDLNKNNNNLNQHLKPHTLKAIAFISTEHNALVCGSQFLPFFLYSLKFIFNIKYSCSQ